MPNVAPVILFAYNRPEYTRAALEAFSRCRMSGQTMLFIHSDGPKPDDEKDLKRVNSVRDVLKNWSRKEKVQCIIRDTHLGLSKSVIQTVNQVCSEHGSVIVLEDDFITTPDFLEFMNQGLNKYQNDDRVMQIAGYMFPVRHPFKPDAFFIPLSSTRGWATWHRAWDRLDQNATLAYERLKSDPQLMRAFNLEGTYPYSKMLQDRIDGEIDSWGILWYWTIFSQNGLVLYPRSSMVYMGGFDGSGTHCGTTPEPQSLTVETVQVPAFPSGFTLPDAIEVCHPAYKRVLLFFRIGQAGDFLSTIKSRLRRMRKACKKLIGRSVV
jgi:GT2 family glycosyltransferase